MIPAGLRRRFGIVEGDVIIAEAHEEGILIRPATALPREIYSPTRKAQFLLNNAVDPEDYARALETVRAMGIDPESVPHEKPATKRRR